MSLAAHATQDAAAAIELDIERNQLRKRDAARRLNVVVNPLFRTVGFSLLAVTIWLHNAFILRAPDSPAFLTPVLVFGLYSLITWAALALWYDRWPGVATFFLVTDLVMLVVGVYFSGGEKSLLFIIPLFRVIDQTHTTFRRALLFGYAAAGSYLALILYLDFVEGRNILWPAEGVKAGMLFFGAIYTALTARSADASKRRTGEAIRLARASIDGLERSQRDLRRVMHENELILLSAGEGIVGFDLDGRVTFANDRAAHTIGYEAADLVGKPGHELAVHCAADGGVCDGTNCPLESILRSGKEESGMNPGFFRKDGTIVPVEYTCAPMYENGRLAGAVFSFRDISKRLEMEREVRAAKNAAEEGSRAKSVFLANMSHELRTPLNAIIGYSEMLAEEVDEEGVPHLKKDVEKIRKSGQHLLSMITDILDIAKLEAGRMQVAAQPIEISSFLADLGTSSQEKFTSSGNQLRIVCDREIGSVETDPLLLRRTLEALLDNANKFSSSSETTLTARRSGDAVTFEVQDHGIGMDPEQVSRIFMPFQPGDASTTKSYSGAGVGLALSHRVITLMGGKLDVQSEQGLGCTVSLELPLRPQLQEVSS